MKIDPEIGMFEDILFMGVKYFKYSQINFNVKFKIKKL